MNTDTPWTLLISVIYIASSTRASSLNFGYNGGLERPIYLLAVPYGERTIPEYEIVFQPTHDNIQKYEQQNRRNDYLFEDQSTTKVPSRRTDYVLKDTVSTTTKSPSRSRGSVKYGEKTSTEPETLENRSSHFRNKNTGSRTESPQSPALSKEFVFESRILLNKPVIRTDDANIASSENSESRHTRPTFTPSRRRSNNKNDTVTSNKLEIETTTPKINSRNRDVKSIYTADNSRNFFRSKLRKNETFTESVETTTPTPLAIKEQIYDSEPTNKQANLQDAFKSTSRRERQKLPEGDIEYGHKKTAASENEELAFVNTPSSAINIPLPVYRHAIKPQINVEIPVSKNVPAQQTTVELSRAPTRETPVQQSIVSSRVPTKNIPVQQNIITASRASITKNLSTQQTLITPSRTPTTKNILVQQTTITPSRASANKNIPVQTTASRVPVQKTTIAAARIPPTSDILLQQEIVTGVQASGTKNFPAQQNVIAPKHPVVKEYQGQQNIITAPRTPTRTRNTQIPDNYVQAHVPRAPKVQAPVDVHITHRGTRKYRPQLQAYNVESVQNSLPISMQNTEQDWKPMIPQKHPQQYHQEVFPEHLFHPEYQQFYHDTPRQTYNHEQNIDNHRYKKNYKNHPQSHLQQYVYLDYGSNGQVSYSLPYSGIPQDNEFFYQQ